MFVLLFQLNMDSVYNIQFLSVICYCEFDIVVDMDGTEGRRVFSLHACNACVPSPRLLTLAIKSSRAF